MALMPQAESSGPKKRRQGLRPRHSRSCKSNAGGSCNCKPSWEAFVYSRGEKKKIRKTFPSHREARAWRNALLEPVTARRLQVPSRLTLAETAYSWLRMAREGEILNRSGHRYKPSALRTIEQNLRLRLIPELGVHAMSEIARADLQRRVGAWRASGLSASAVRGTVNAARVLWRDFDLITGIDNQLPVDPTRRLRLPADTGKRDRIATPDEALRLIEALDEGDQALWETAMTAGLRHGELRALRVDDLDFANKRINVRRGWDQYEGEIDVKSEKGDRSTVIMNRLEQRLTEHLARTGASGSDLVFGRDAWTPFASSTVNRRARRAWAAAREREDLENEIPQAERIRPIGLHECRHTAVSQMLDAGISIYKVSKFIGHASIAITVDRYGHLLPEGEAEAVALLNAYHERRRR